MDDYDLNILIELLKHFDTEEECVNFLAQLRWGNMPICPYCNHDKSYVINTANRGKRWKCKKCLKQYSVRVGTIFEDSKLPLKKWLIAIGLLINNNNRYKNSHKLARILNITQKSSWLLINKISGELKKCTKCGQLKKLDSFTKAPNGKPMARCKNCCKIIARENRSKKKLMGINLEVLNDSFLSGSYKYF